MSKMVEVLTWDSQFFRLRIGRATISRLDEQTVAQLLQEAQECDLQCVYFEADANDSATVILAERYSFHLVDVRVVLEHPFGNRPVPVPIYPIASDLVITAPRNDELERLQDIAAQIGDVSRFNFDPHFAASDCDQLYRLWVENSCAGFADVVLVARWSEAGDAAGLITCTLRDKVAHIQLAGVHADHRQKGIGTALVQAALEWAKTSGAEKMEVVTQARNVFAQRLYQQLGFFTRSMTLYYHKWL